MKLRAVVVKIKSHKLYIYLRWVLKVILWTISCFFNSNGCRCSTELTRYRSISQFLITDIFQLLIFPLPILYWIKPALQKRTQSYYHYKNTSLSSSKVPVCYFSLHASTSTNRLLSIVLLYSIYHHTFISLKNTPSDLYRSFYSYYIYNHTILS